MSKAKIKVTFRNSTEFDISFIVGKNSYTIAPNQSTKVTISKNISIEAKPKVFGVNSSFLVGGLKHDAILECSLDKDSAGNKHKLLLLPVKA